MSTLTESPIHNQAAEYPEGALIRDGIQIIRDKWRKKGTAIIAYSCYEFNYREKYSPFDPDGYADELLETHEVMDRVEELLDEQAGNLDYLHIILPA